MPLDRHHRRDFLLMVRLCMFLLVILLLGRVAAAQPPDSADRDYRGELPRLAPKSPADALRTFRTADGFRMDLVASEPLVMDPVAIAFDENGRMFVVEMRGYSEDDRAMLGRIRVLEDMDRDGYFDRSHVFVDGLSWPTAVTCYDGGVFVGAAPDLLYFKDTDGDQRADVRQVVFTGFGRSNVQGLMNTLKWGLDNRVHGAASSSGAEIPLSASQMLRLRGRDFAFDPRTGEIQATSGGGQHGLSFDTHGNKFVCSNSNHIQQVMFEDRYVARNPFLAAPSSRITIAADGPQADVFRSSPVEPWRIVRTRLRVKGIVPGPIERGGKAAGYFTGATGVTIYTGSAWPAEYANLAIIGDVGSNLVHRKRLAERDLEFVAQRIDSKSEFVTSTDNWFRPVQFANGPDGALYVVDMYREVIEHPKSLPPAIKRHLDLTSGRDRGRIYRIVPADFKQPATVRLGEAETAELVGLLAHRNGWHRETASRLLHQRQDRRAVGPLEQLVKSAVIPDGQIRALYALNSLNALTAATVLAASRSDHELVRRHAVRLAEFVAGDSPELRDRLYAMTNDPDQRVRYQLAFSLGSLSGPKRDQALAGLARRDGASRWMRIAVRSSLAEGSGAVLAQLLGDSTFASSAHGRQWIAELAAQIGKQKRADDVAAVLRAIGKRDLPPAALAAVVKGVAAPPGSPLAVRLSAASEGRLERVTAELLEQSARTAADTEQSVANRVQAVQSLALGTFSQFRELLGALLDPGQPQEVQNAALAVLATYEDRGVAQLLLDRWSRLSPRLRSRTGDVLFSRRSWIHELMTALKTNRIASAELAPGRLALLANHPDQSVRDQANAILKSTVKESRAEVLRDYQPVLQMEGDILTGKAVFKKTCAPCHQIESVGHPLAPNLAAMQNRGPEAILLNVLDPNREVNPQYLNYTLATKDGRILSGMISAETSNSVTLRRADDASDTVLRIDIAELKSTGLSLMAEGLEKEISKQAMADLIAYLLSVE